MPAPSQIPRIHPGGVRPLSELGLGVRLLHKLERVGITTTEHLRRAVLNQTMPMALTQAEAAQARLVLLEGWR